MTLYTYTVRTIAIALVWGTVCTPVHAGDESSPSDSIQQAPSEWLSNVNAGRLDAGIAAIPGYSAITSGWTGHPAGLSFRGAHPSFLRVHVDGISCASALFGMYDLQNILPAAVQAVKIRRWSPHFLTGNSTVNLFSFRSAQHTPVTRLTFQSGSLGSNDLEILFHRMMWQETNLTVDVGLQEADGELGMDDFAGKRIFMQLERNWTPQLNVAASLLYYQRDVNTVTNSTEPLPPLLIMRRDLARWHERRTIANLAVYHRSPGTAPDLDLHITWSNLVGKFRSPVTGAVQPSDTASEQSIAMTGRATKSLPVGDLHAEIRLQHDRHRLNFIFPTDTLAIDPDGRTGIDLIAGYGVQDAAGRWRASVGAGGQRYGGYGFQPVLDAEVAWHRGAGSVAALRGGMDVRFPSEMERLHPVSPEAVLNNEHTVLKPERMSYVDVRYVQHRDAAWEWKSAVYWQQVRNPVTVSASQSPLNGDAGTSIGAELQGMWHAGRLWKLDGAVHAQHWNRYESVWSPRESGQAGISWLHPVESLFPSSLRSSIRFSVQWIGRRKLWYYVPRSRSFGVGDRWLGSDWTGHLTAQAQLGQVRVRYEMENLWGQGYSIIAGFPSPGRIYRFRVDWEFLN